MFWASTADVHWVTLLAHIGFASVHLYPKAVEGLPNGLKKLMSHRELFDRLYVCSRGA